MKVFDAIVILAQMDPNTEIVTGSDDHSYRSVNLSAGTMLKDKDGNMTEDHGEAFTPESHFGKRMPVIIVQ